jgi:hypothetical protein
METPAGTTVHNLLVAVVLFGVTAMTLGIAGSFTNLGTSAYFWVVIGGYAPPHLFHSDACHPYSFTLLFLAQLLSPLIRLAAASLPHCPC